MTQRQHGSEQVILVHINFPAGAIKEDLNEFKELATSAGAKIAGEVVCTRRTPDSKYFIGSGKAEEIRELVLATGASLVLFNHELSPAQERNLEKLIQCRTLSRTGLILDIFAQRARSFEGVLQVELAILNHQATRLVRGWTHLERQRGGIGLRGPGETQLEVDRRLIRNRIKMITSKLAKIRKQREQGRRARRRAIVPTVALVGYTNAGKSTLFNKMTGADVYAANQLFATLDPTFRRIDFPEMGPVILADTVGFIRHLPHDLVEAFHATLEEVSEADLLLHVVDVNDEERQTHIDQVDQVLDQIGAHDVPRIVVFNKIDLRDEVKEGIERDDLKEVRRVFLSAVTGAGIDELVAAISEKLGLPLVKETVVLEPSETKLRALLYARKAVLDEQIDEEGHFALTVKLPKLEMEKLKQR